MNHDEAPTAVKPAAIRAFARWYSPYVAGVRGTLALTIVAVVIVLACQAVIPLLVEAILHHAEWSTSQVTLLIALAVTMLVVSYLAHLGAHRVANASAACLRETLFDRLLTSRVLRQKGLLRSSVVLRFTADVDRISDAFEATIVDGLPGVARLVISLALLTYVEWRAGVAMMIASILFLLLRRLIGTRLDKADTHRLHVQSSLGETVDEAITTARATEGLSLRPWQRARFTGKVQTLEHASHRQGVLVSRLILAAHATAMIGLIVVVVTAVALGGENLAAVAAALLYLEGAARGLEALPPWLRDVQLAIVSEHRLDGVLKEPTYLGTADTSGLTATPGLALHDVTSQELPGVLLRSVTVALPTHAVIGLVADASVEADAVLALLAGDDNPDAGVVTLEGVDVRSLGSGRALALVPAESAMLDASAQELFMAVQPGIAGATTASLLSSVGLEHLLAFPDGVEHRLGPKGTSLTVDERQRLMLAIALASRPTALLIGSLLCLADVDTAMPILGRIREDAPNTTIITVSDATVAEAMDAIAFVSGGGLSVAHHRDLLVSSTEYADLWERRLRPSGIDLTAIGIDSQHQELMLTRLVTERYSEGDLIYREGAPADRVLFIFSGHAEITVATNDGERRVAVLGPGSHCGDLRLTVGELRAESAYALDDCVIRSLSREAISAGITGLLDRTPTERRIVASLLRLGAASRDGLRARLADVDDQQFNAALALLERDGAVRVTDDGYAPVLRRGRRMGSEGLLDRLTDL